MPNIETNPTNIQETEKISSENHEKSKDISVNDMANNFSTELNNLVEPSALEKETNISELHLPPDDVQNNLEEISEINQEERELTKEWEGKSKEIINNQNEINKNSGEISAISHIEHESKENSKKLINEENEKTPNESNADLWIKAVEQNFGINDFNPGQFLRTRKDVDKINKALSEGKDQAYIDNNIEDYKIQDYDQLLLTYNRMKDIENEQKGSIKLLNEKLGIVNFQRYSKEMLLSQLQETDPTKEIGLFLSSVADHNGAFDREELYEKIYTNIKDNLNIKIVEASSKTELKKQLINIQKEINENKSGKIKFAMISAHSQKEQFYLTDEPEKKFIHKDDIEKNSPKLKHLFADNAQVIGNSCSAGALNG